MTYPCRATVALFTCRTPVPIGLLAYQASLRVSAVLWLGAMGLFGLMVCGWLYLVFGLGLNESETGDTEA